MKATPIFDQHYWEARYKNRQTEWDIGTVSRPIKQYIDQLENKELKILVPGAGNGHEAAYLWSQGFENVYVLDIACQPLHRLYLRTNLPKAHLLQQDFFDFEGQFDLIIEQTFFCALHPGKRQEYAKKMHGLLRAQGKLAGLLFDFGLTEKGPPFGGSLQEYLSYFTGYFQIKTMERCYNSIEPRRDKELFFIFEKK